MSQENNSNPEERKLEPYHYEAMVRAEIEKRMAAEKERTSSQEILFHTYQEPPVNQNIQPANPTWPTPVQTGNFPTAQPQQYPVNPQQYYSGQLPIYQQPQPQPAPYYQPQPQPYYQPPPAPAPVVNVTVQSTNVNQNVNRNYYGRRSAAHGHIGCFNICYFLCIGWALGATVGFFGICALPFSRSAADGFFRTAFFLSFLA